MKELFVKSVNFIMLRGRLTNPMDAMPMGLNQRLYHQLWSKIVVGKSVNFINQNKDNK